MLFLRGRGLLGVASMGSSVVGIAACLVACGGDAGGLDGTNVTGGEATGSVASPIITGTASPASQDAVVYIATFVSPGAYNACSGTLIAPNLVLTARHCVAQISQGPNGFACDENGAIVSGQLTLTGDYPADQIRVYTGAQGPAGDSTITTKGIVAKKIISNGSKGLCSNDIALIVLSSPVTNAKVAALRLDGTIDVADTFTAVGYGLVAAGTDGARLQRTGIAILRTGPEKGSPSTTAVSTNEFEVGEAPCEGDSGGPALDTNTGAIIGVVSRGGNGGGDVPAACIGAKTRNLYTATTPFKALILGAFKEAGATPTLEPGSSATLPAAADSGGCATVPSRPSANGAAAGALALLLAAFVGRGRRRTRPQP